MGEKVVLAGGSGFLGLSLAARLRAMDYDVVILTRGPSRHTEAARFVQWDGRTAGEWYKEVNGARAVVNFTGKSVNCIYTKANKAAILSSRLDSVTALHDAILRCEQPPEVFIQAGSLAIFGNTTETCDEHSSYGEGFSADVCKRWEEAFYARELPATRQVLFRIGFVLGPNGGALEPLVQLARWGLGGTIGSGKQYISWLHIEDMNEMFLAAIDDRSLQGTYNATGPHPVTNREFMSALRSAMHKGWAPPAPTPFAWLGAYLVMRADPGLALTGRKCIPGRLRKEHDFQFQYTDLKATLKQLVQTY